jgi:hypothetical protein
MTLVFVAEDTFGPILQGFYVLANKRFFLNSPKVMEEETVIVSVTMRKTASHCLDHGSFFSFSIANVAVAGLKFFLVASAAVPATVTSIIHLLTILMNPHVALWAVENRIGELCNFTKASRTRSSQ